MELVFGGGSSSDCGRRLGEVDIVSRQSSSALASISVLGRGLCWIAVRMGGYRTMTTVFGQNCSRITVAEFLHAELPCLSAPYWCFLLGRWPLIPNSG